MSELPGAVDDAAILEASIAFIRQEARAADLTAFDEQEEALYRKNRRVVALRQLRDRLTTACESALTAHPHWPELGDAAQRAILLIAEQAVYHGAAVSNDVALRCVLIALQSTAPRRGRPVTPTQIRDDLIRLGLVHPLHALHANESHWAPICVPLDALRDDA
jgi:hypothetical protein